MTDTPFETAGPALRLHRRRDDARMHTAEMAALPPSVLEDELLGSGPVAPPMPRWQMAALVAAGGALGAVLRWTLALIEPTTATTTLIDVPWATFGANLLGCLGLGALSGALEVRPTRQRWLQPLLGPGVFGGFTTMSTLVMEGTAMMGAGFPYLAGVYALATLVLCLLACILGIAAGHRIARALVTYERVRAREDVPVTTGETLVVDLEEEDRLGIDDGLGSSLVIVDSPDDAAPDGAPSPEDDAPDDAADDTAAEGKSTDEEGPAAAETPGEDR